MFVLLLTVAFFPRYVDMMIDFHKQIILIKCIENSMYVKIKRPFFLKSEKKCIFSKRIIVLCDKFNWLFIFKRFGSQLLIFFLN